MADYAGKNITEIFKEKRRESEKLSLIRVLRVEMTSCL